jgi:hypothetical protein
MGCGRYVDVVIGEKKTRGHLNGAEGQSPLGAGPSLYDCLR